MPDNHPPRGWAPTLDSLLLPLAALGVAVDRGASHLARQITGESSDHASTKDLRRRLRSTFHSRAIGMYLREHSGRDLVIVKGAGGRPLRHLLWGHQLLISLHSPRLKPEHLYRGLGGVFADPSEPSGPDDGAVGDRAVICMVGVYEGMDLVAARVFSPRGRSGNHWSYTFSAEALAGQLRRWAEATTLPNFLREIQGVLSLRPNPRLMEARDGLDQRGEVRASPLTFSTPPPPASRGREERGSARR